MGKNFFHIAAAVMKKCLGVFHVDVFDGTDLTTYVESSYTEGEIG